MQNLWSKISFCIFLTISLIPKQPCAQNLIFNGSFELNICPTVPGMWNNLLGTMTAESGWLNIDDVNIDCNNPCFYSSPGMNYGVIYGDTAEANCCGKRCAYRSTSSTKFDKDYIVKGALYYDTSGMQTSSYLAQKLENRLKIEHRYFFYMFYTFHRIGSLPPPNPYKKMEVYEYLNKVPNITHDGFGVAFSTYYNHFPKSFQYSPKEQDLLPTSSNQRKLRFTTSYSKNWRKLGGTFVADSAYQYLTIGNFWKTEEINFDPPLKQMAINPFLIYLDSINLWDVTHRIVADSQYCLGQKASIYAQNYSPGNSSWFDKNGNVLGFGNTLEITLFQDTFIYSKRYFPEIQYTSLDSFCIKVKNKAPVFTITRLQDSCKLPATLEALPSHLTYTWNGVDNGKNNFTLNQSGEVQITATDSNHCIAKHSYFVQPDINFSVSLISDSCSETAVLSMFPKDYKYYFEKKLISNPFNTRLKKGLYIIAEQNNGCRDSQYFYIPLCIVQEDLIWIPNAFTPNYDNLNHRFGPVSQYIKSYELSIFNRWGEKIFVSDLNTPSWDGTYQNYPVQGGVYFYQLSLELINNKTMRKSGSVTLLR